MCCTQLCWSETPFGTFASLGSLPVMLKPVLFDTPLPASAYHCQSLPVCGPYFACEKLASFPRPLPTFASQSMIGTVIIGCAPAPRLVLMNVSPRSPAVGLGSPRLSKYQSWPRLSAFCCQL